MTITPTGSAPWLHVNSFEHYGGDLNKRNYQSQGAVNAQTDVTAQQFSRLTADLAAVQRVAPFAVINYTNNDLTPAAPTINVVRLQTGVTSASYAGDSPPAGFPSAARNGDGDVTFTFASSYTDDYGVTGALVINGAEAGANGPATGVIATANALTDTTVQVVTITDTGAAAQEQTVTVEVHT